MSNELTDDDTAIVAGYISSERLQRFVNHSGNVRAAVQIHQHLLQVASALAPVIAMIEIALRNVICEKLTVAFGTNDWLRDPLTNFKWRQEEFKKIQQSVRNAQRAEYAKKTNSEKIALDVLAYPTGVPAGTSHEERVKKRQKAIMVGNGQVIAQLSLYFWKRLFSSDYEQDLWKRSLRQIFPNKRLSRTDISNSLEVIYQARNRIAHHEPIDGARLVSLLEAIEYFARNFMTRFPSSETPLSKLLHPHRVLLDKRVQDLNGT
jgi:hypothetical protein